MIDSTHTASRRRCARRDEHEEFAESDKLPCGDYFFHENELLDVAYGKEVNTFKRFWRFITRRRSLL